MEKRKKTPARNTPRRKQIKWSSEKSGTGTSRSTYVSGATSAAAGPPTEQALEQLWLRLFDDLEKHCRDDDWDFVVVGYRDDGGDLTLSPGRFDRYGRWVPSRLDVNLCLKTLAREYESLPDAETDEAKFEKAHRKLQALALRLVKDSLSNQQTKRRMEGVRSRRPFAVYWWDGYDELQRSKVRHLAGSEPNRSPEPLPADPLEILTHNLNTIDAAPTYALQLKKQRVVGVSLLFNRRAGIRILRPLIELTDLEKLNFAELPLTDQQLADILTNKPRLRVIDFLKIKVGDTSAKAIAALPQLTHLELVNCSKLTPTALDTLTRCQHLNLLKLRFHKGVDDRLIRKIAKMPKLKTLDLAGASVTDKAIPDIVAIQGLTRLVVARTGISAAGVTELKRKLPRLRVITELG